MAVSAVKSASGHQMRGAGKEKGGGRYGYDLQRLVNPEVIIFVEVSSAFKNPARLCSQPHVLV